MDILINEILPIGIIDAMARDVLGSDVSGVSVGDNTRIHLLNESQENQDVAHAILDNYDLLVVTADKTTMVEGDADPIISCNDSLIASDPTIKYIVFIDGEEYASGTDTVVDGVVNLRLSSPVSGEYEIFIYRSVGQYESGKIKIVVSEG